MRLKSLALLTLLFSISAHAEDVSPIFQTHGRFGYLASTFVVPGIVTGNYNSGSTFDLSIEYLPKKSISYLTRVQLSFDTESTTIRYLYAGLGSRFYFGQAARSEVSESGSSIASLPKWRYYASWDGAIAQMLVYSLSPSVGSTVSVLEFSGGLGTIYQISKDVGLEASAEYGNGFGFTGVSATTQTMKVLVGASIYY
jgi:hypothetical protein